MCIQDGTFYIYIIISEFKNKLENYLGFIFKLHIYLFTFIMY